MESKNIRKNLNAIGAVLVGFFVFVMFLEFIFDSARSKFDRINHISFSPDGKNLLFDRSKGDRRLRLHVYDFATGELSAYQSPDGEYWSMGRYSRDGKRIVFVIMPLLCSFTGFKSDPVNMQIAIMDPDGRNVRVITSTPGVKIFPSFSHTGKKIIFAKAGRIMTEGRTPAADYDFFEVDVETGKETRLTNFKFFMVSPPSYLPDDKTFIFSAYGPSELVNIGMSLTDRSKYEYLHAKYDRDNIYRLRAGQQELEPYVVPGKEQPREPLVTPDGEKLFFHGQAYKPDGKGDRDQFFRYATDGKHQRVSNLKFGIWSSAVSPDGKLLASVGGGTEIRRIEICQVQDGSCQELFLPGQAAIINELR
jgi:Tol biopolymer transport system component